MPRPHAAPPRRCCSASPPCAAVLTACGCNEDGAGHGRAGARGARHRARRRGLQRLHHAPAEPEDHRRTRRYVEAREPAPGETLYGVFIQVCNRSKDTAPDGRATSSSRTTRATSSSRRSFRRTTRSPTTPRALEPKECIPEAGSVAQLGPTGGLDAPVQAARSRTPRTARSSSRSRARATSTSPSSWTSEGKPAHRATPGAGAHGSAASSTTRAAGAAVAPPAPARTSITATAIRGRSPARRR